jgi:hypothetical protein
MDMLVSAVSVKLSVSGNGKVLLRETVFAAARTAFRRLSSSSPRQSAVGADEFHRRVRV